jgi:hypothetical protein
MNSSISTLAPSMRLTALHPPPPTPITFIFAGDNSSLKLMRIAVSFAVMYSPYSPNFRLVSAFSEAALRVNFLPTTAGINRR